MFFFKKKREETEKESERVIRSDSLAKRIKSKLDEIRHTTTALNETIEHTQVANVKLALKLKKHLMGGGKSFSSFSDKLTVGVLIVDSKGLILQENPKAKEFLHCDGSCIDMPLFNLILEIQPIDPPGEKLLLTTEFFSTLSDCIVRNMADCNLSENEVCSLCINALPCSLKPDEEQLVLVTTNTNPEQILMKFTFSILDNGPEEAEDIAYVVIFRPFRPVKK